LTEEINKLMAKQYELENSLKEKDENIKCINVTANQSQKELQKQCSLVSQELNKLKEAYSMKSGEHQTLIE